MKATFYLIFVYTADSATKFSNSTTVVISKLDYREEHTYNKKKVSKLIKNN